MLGGLCILSILCDVSFALRLMCSVSVYFGCDFSSCLRAPVCALYCLLVAVCVVCSAS